MDTGRLRNTLANLHNFGGYFPQYRAVNESHCTSIIEFANADIQEQNLQLDDFVTNVLDGSGPVMDASRRAMLPIGPSPSTCSTIFSTNCSDGVSRGGRSASRSQW